MARRVITNAFRGVARMTPIRARIVGPPSVATRISACNSCPPLGGLVNGLRKLRDVRSGVLKGDELAPARQAAPLSHLVARGAASCPN
jgi:hypothetical protein